MGFDPGTLVAGDCLHVHTDGRLVPHALEKIVYPLLLAFRLPCLYRSEQSLAYTLQPIKVQAVQAVPSRGGLSLLYRHP